MKTKNPLFEVSIEIDPTSAAEPKIISIEVAPAVSLRGFALYRALVKQAATSAAAAQVDYNSFSSDSAYANEIDRRRDTMRITAINAAGEPKAFLALGIYDGYPESGTWCDRVTAVSTDDAQLQAAWTMALNSNGDELPSGSAESIDDFFELVEAQDVVYCEPAPPDMSQLALLPESKSGLFIIASVAELKKDPSAHLQVEAAEKLGVGFVALSA